MSVGSESESRGDSLVRLEHQPLAQHRITSLAPGVDQKQSPTVKQLKTAAVVFALKQQAAGLPFPAHSEFVTHLRTEFPSINIPIPDYFSSTIERIILQQNPSLNSEGRIDGGLFFRRHAAPRTVRQCENILLEADYKAKIKGEAFYNSEAYPLVRQTLPKVLLPDLFSILRDIHSGKLKLPPDFRLNQAASSNSNAEPANVTRMDLAMLRAEGSDLKVADYYMCQLLLQHPGWGSGELLKELNSTLEATDKSARGRVANCKSLIAERRMYLDRHDNVKNISKPEIKDDDMELIRNCLRSEFRSNPLMNDLDAIAKLRTIDALKNISRLPRIHALARPIREELNKEGIQTSATPRRTNPATRVGISTNPIVIN